MNKEKENIDNKIYFGKYKQDKKIGEGSFGKIYIAININNNEKFAVKLETKSGQNLLESEAYVLCYLKGRNKLNNLAGIPYVKSYGFSGDNNVLVMELLHKSLEDIFQELGCKFSLRTVCNIGIQMLDRIEYVHSKHIIHRDIKPDNFVMGVNQNSQTLYIIDFGLAKKFRSSRTLHHIAFKSNKKLTGTARYASINALKGLEQSRRDDLEAIGYVLMYFLRGSLPWQGLKIDKKDDRYKRIYEKKKSTTAEELCMGFSNEFCEYINYTRNLTFEQEPDYNYLRDLLRKIISDNHFDPKTLFDWDTKIVSVDKNINKFVTPVKINLVKKENNITTINNWVKTRHNSNNNIDLPKINNNKSNLNPAANDNVNPNKKKLSLIINSNANSTKKNFVHSYSNNNGILETEVPKSKLNISSVIVNNESKVINNQYLETNNNTSTILEKKISRNNIFQQSNTIINNTKEEIRKKSNISLNQSTFNQNKFGLSNSYVKSPIKSDIKPYDKKHITRENNLKTANTKPVNKNDSKCIII